MMKKPNLATSETFQVHLLYSKTTLSLNICLYEVIFLIIENF